MKDRNSQGEIARRLECDESREADALALALADLDFVIACCSRLLDDQQVPLGGRGIMKNDEAYQRALWDAALVTFYKHYEHPAHTSVSSAMQELLATTSNKNVQRHFENWRQERHQRVAHPVGRDESYRTGVFRAPEGSGVITISRRRVRTDDDGIRWFRIFVQTVMARIEERSKQVQRALQVRLDQLSEEEYKRLPSLPLGDHRRPPGIERLS